MIELAAVGPGGSMAAHAIAARQGMPVPFLLNVLADLRRAGIVDSRPGARGGWWLERAAEEITVADVIHAVDGPLLGSAAARPRLASNGEIGGVLDQLWRAVGIGVIELLQHTTIAGLLPIGWRDSDPTAVRVAC
jgi:Rrf2 family protein